MSHVHLQRSSSIGAIALVLVAVGLWGHVALVGHGAWSASLVTVLAGQAGVTYLNVYCHGGTRLNSKVLTDQLTRQVADDVLTELGDGLRGHVTAAVETAMVDYVPDMAEAKRIDDRIQSRWGTKPTSDGNTA